MGLIIPHGSDRNKVTALLKIGEFGKIHKKFTNKFLFLV